MNSKMTADLIRIGTQDLKHRYQGACPDVTQTGTRDPLCAACKTLILAEAALTETAVPA